MGHVIASVKIQQDGKAKEFKLLVDTGSTYTWLPARDLERLGVPPMRSMRFESIDGGIVKRPIGDAVVECLGRKATTIVVFGRTGDSKVLGAYALEGLALEVDPGRKRLKRARAVLAV